MPKMNWVLTRDAIVGLCSHAYRPTSASAHDHRPADRRQHFPGLSDLMAVLSYDKKPGIQALESTGPDLPRAPGKHSAIGRDHKYIRHGTLSLLAGIDLLSGEGGQDRTKARVADPPVSKAHKPGPDHPWRRAYNTMKPSWPAKVQMPTPVVGGREASL